MPDYEQLLDAQISLIRNCDVGKTEVLKNLSVFFDRFVAGIMSSYSETLRLIVQAKKPLLLLDDVDLICMSCIRRQLEVEVYVPMIKQVNARLEKEVDKKQETLLNRKMDILQVMVLYHSSSSSRVPPPAFSLFTKATTTTTTVQPFPLAPLLLLLLFPPASSSPPPLPPLSSP